MPKTQADINKEYSKLATELGDYHYKLNEWLPRQIASVQKKMAALYLEADELQKAEAKKDE